MHEEKCPRCHEYCEALVPATIFPTHCVREDRKLAKYHAREWMVCIECRDDINRTRSLGLLLEVEDEVADFYNRLIMSGHFPW